MTTRWMVHACLLVGLASALVAGVFQAFSDFIMRGLALTEVSGGIESMQRINTTVLRSAFLTTFFALVPATLALAAYAWVQLAGPGRTLILTGAALYLVTVFLVTLLRNVPMNERLAAVALANAEAESYWFTYGRVWTQWNHVRAIGAATAASCFLLAAVRLP